MEMVRKIMVLAALIVFGIQGDLYAGSASRLYRSSQLPQQALRRGGQMGTEYATRVPTSTLVRPTAPVRFQSPWQGSARGMLTSRPSSGQMQPVGGTVWTSSSQPSQIGRFGAAARVMQLKNPEGTRGFFTPGWWARQLPEEQPKQVAEENLVPFGPPTEAQWKARLQEQAENDLVDQLKKEHPNFWWQYQAAEKEIGNKYQKLIYGDKVKTLETQLSNGRSLKEEYERALQSGKLNLGEEVVVNKKLGEVEDLLESLEKRKERNAEKVIAEQEAVFEGRKGVEEGRITRVALPVGERWSYELAERELGPEYRALIETGHYWDVFENNVERIREKYERLLQSEKTTLGQRVYLKEQLEKLKNEQKRIDNYKQQATEKANAAQALYSFQQGLTKGAIQGRASLPPVDQTDFDAAAIKYGPRYAVLVDGEADADKALENLQTIKNEYVQKLQSKDWAEVKPGERVYLKEQLKTIEEDVQPKLKAVIAEKRAQNAEVQRIKDVETRQRIADVFKRK